MSIDQSTCYIGLEESRKESPGASDIYRLEGGG